MTSRARRLLRAYQRLFVRLRSPHPVVKQTAETGELGTLVGVNTANGCLLACFDRLFTPSEACVTVPTVTCRTLLPPPHTHACAHVYPVLVIRVVGWLCPKARCGWLTCFCCLRDARWQVRCVRQADQGASPASGLTSRPACAVVSLTWEAPSPALLSR